MIVAIVDKDRTYFGFGAGNMPIRYQERRDIFMKENSPIFKINGLKNGYMAFSETWSEGDLLRYEKFATKSGELNMKTFNQEILPKIQDILKERNRLTDEGECKNYYLFAQGNNCIALLPSFSMMQVDDYFIIGDWTDCEVTSLEMTKGLPPEDRIRKLFETMEELDLGQEFPVVVTDTKSKRVKILERNK